MSFSPAVRAYDAISGPELIKIVQDLVGEALANSGEFAVNFAFPVIKDLKFELEFDYFPSFASPHKTIEITIAGPNAPANAGDAERVSVKGGLRDIGETVPPDQMRDEHNLRAPIPPKIGPSILVDKLIKAAGEPSK